jgi:hypothetical protein
MNTELLQISVLRSLFSMPLTPLLRELVMLECISEVHPFCSVSQSLALSCASEISSRFNLNPEQSKVLTQCANWFGSSNEALSSSPSRFVLCHGVFGSGKSTLLIAAIHMFRDIRENSKHPIRVLLAAGTNVAVDRILMGLLTELENDDHCDNVQFHRVGSAKKVAKPVLRYMAADKDVIRDLQQMKRASRNKTERKHVDEALNVLTTKQHSRKDRVARSMVVGVTCASSASTLLEDQTFDVLILDECSQITEPLSLLPLIKSRCHHVLLVGDPKQLYVVPLSLSLYIHNFTILDCSTFHQNTGLRP